MRGQVSNRGRDVSEIWKSNWEETKRHFVDWWHHEGLVLNAGTVPAARPHAEVEVPGPKPDEWYLDPEWVACSQHHAIAGREYVADAVPMVCINTGPGALSTMLGSEPVFEPDTVWYRPCIAECERHPTLRYAPRQRWAEIHREMYRACVNISGGHYYVGCVDLIENFDTYCQLRGNQPALTDLLDRPTCVTDRIEQINQAFFDAFDDFCRIAAHPDGSTVFWPFGLWSPGKVAKVQCDASAMLSPAMFRDFVAPALARQCEWLDHSMFHLDGSQCIVHLDALLEIEALDAVEWTPDPKVPPGGDPIWYDMYCRVLNAGKSVQVIQVQAEEVAPLLDTCGPKGVYLAMGDCGPGGPEEVIRTVERYRD